MRQIIRAAALLALVAPALSAQGTPAPAPQGPQVGEMAPDFTLAVAGRHGVADKPITLSSLRGKTVVLAFFPRARTSGCTIQMKAYRDQYATLFNGGNGVVVLPISTDSSSVLASWAADESFPFQMVSDVDGVAGRAYATLAPGRNAESRVLFVIGPDGTIRKIMRPFREIDATAYTELAEAVKAAR